MMRIRALYVGKTYSIWKAEPHEYAIVDERYVEHPDIVVLSKEPQDGLVRFSDVARGISENPEWEAREYILIVTGTLRRTTNIWLYRLEDVRVEKKIHVGEAVAKLLSKAEELSKLADEGKAIKPGDNVVSVGDLEFKIIRYKPCSSSDEVVSTILNLYRIVTAARKRSFISSPTLVEITHGSETKWYAVTLPVAYYFMKENPDAVAQAGIIDEQGFKAPYIIVRGMTPEDLGTAEMQRAAVPDIDKLITLYRGVGVETQAGGVFGGRPSPIF